MNDRPARQTRADYRRFVPISTRWSDNDIYGHVNNVVYYAFFDTAVNQLLIQSGLLAPATSPAIGLVVETSCTYFETVTYPEGVEVGVRVSHIGRSSVRYAVATFRVGSTTAAAQGEFTHVYVDRATQKPVPIGSELREYFKNLSVS